jgi:hypothetical protein
MTLATLLATVAAWQMETAVFALGVTKNRAGPPRV